MKPCLHTVQLNSNLTLARVRLADLFLNTVASWLRVHERVSGRHTREARQILE